MSTGIIITVLILLTAFAVSTAFLYNNNFDQKVLDWVAPYISAGRTRIMIIISFFGNARFLVPANLLLILFFIIIKNKWWAIRVTIIALSSLGLMNLLKWLFQRLRPDHPLVDGITNYSFPSGHAFMSVAFYGLLAYWFTERIKKREQQRILIMLVLLFILLISFSRIYLRVHYTTDIIAGLALGTGWLIFASAMINKLQAGKIKNRES